MMAGLFLLMSVGIILTYLRQRNWVIAFILITLGLCWLMFWYHATEALEINW